MEEETEVKQNLASATFQELVSEIMERCASAVLIVERPLPRGDPTENDSQDAFFRKGSLYSNLGMMNVVGTRLMQEAFSRREG